MLSKSLFVCWSASIQFPLLHFYEFNQPFVLLVLSQRFNAAGDVLMVPPIVLGKVLDRTQQLFFIADYWVLQVQEGQFANFLCDGQHFLFFPMQLEVLLSFLVDVAPHLVYFLCNQIDHLCLSQLTFSCFFSSRRAMLVSRYDSIRMSSLSSL